MNWENDPALRKIKKDFMDSFPERAEQVRQLLTQAISLEGLREVQAVAHKLGGVASTYGFVTLGEVAGALDDFLERAPDSEKLAQGPSYGKALAELLIEQSISVQDCQRWREDPRVILLISAVESLPGEAKS